MEEGGKEGKRGPFRGQNFCRLEEGWADVGGARVRGRGWSEGGTPGEAGEKKKHNHHVYSISAKSGKRAEKYHKWYFLYTPKSEVLGAKWKWPEKYQKWYFLYTPKSGVLEPF